MSRRGGVDEKRAPQPDGRQAQDSQEPQEPQQIAPGKRTRTSRPPPMRTPPQAPVPQQPGPMDEAARRERAALTARWMDTALRPDLCPPPVQRQSAGNEGTRSAEAAIPLVVARVREGLVTWHDTGVMPPWLLGLAPDQAAGPAATPAPAGPPPGATTAGTPDAALAAELGLTLTTTPPIGAGERALVGMQVTFQLDLLRPPHDLAVTITGWELATPRGRFAARPAGPATTLPITAPGPHVFRAQIRLSDGRGCALEQRFEAETAATRAHTALAQADAVTFEQQQSQLALSRTLLGPPGPAEQGQGATRRIVTSAPNPARANATRPAELAFAVQEDQRADHAAPETHHRWTVRPLRWDGMPAALGGHARAKTPEGLDAYDLGTGPAARFPAAHENLYVVLCQIEDAQGRPLGDARYLQSVVGEREERALAALDRHIGRMDDLGGRIQGPRVPVTAVHVATRSGRATPLRLYLGRAKADPSKLLLVDLTPGLDAEQSKLVYEGASASAVLDAFAAGNKYPAGMLSLRVDTNGADGADGADGLGIEPMARQIETDGESTLERLSSLSGIASLALGVGAVVAAPFTGGGSLVVLTLVVGAAAAGVTAGALSLADRLQNEELDQVGVALDVLTIATSFLNAGLAVKALRAGPAMLVASRGGRYLLWSGFAAEGLSGILVTVEAAEQIMAVAESDLAPDQKLGALVRVVSSLILTGALLGVSYGELRSVRGRLAGPLGQVESELSDASRMTLSLLDGDTLRGLQGATARDAERLARMLRDDPGLVTRLAGHDELVPALRAARGNTATDLELAFRHVRLRARGIDDTQIERLAAAMREAGFEARLLPRLSDDTLARLADPAVLGELEQVARLQRSGRITGLDAWIEFGAAKDATDLGRVVGELREARRLVTESPGAVVDVGGDAKAPMDPATGERMQSFDLTIENSAGTITRNVEVTTVDALLKHPAGITSGVIHATSKVASRRAADQPMPGLRDVTIRITVARSFSDGKRGVASIDTMGNRVLHTRNGMDVPQGNIFDGVAVHLPRIPSHKELDRITLADAASGSVLAQYDRMGATWSRIR